MSSGSGWSQLGPRKYKRYPKGVRLWAWRKETRITLFFRDRFPSELNGKGILSIPNSALGKTKALDNCDESAGPDH